MALNLSTLTNPATSGDVLAEALTTADFLEPCPVLRNLSRGSNKGGDAKQDVALNQPKALPLIDGDGYLYLSGVSGNFCEIPNDSSLAEIREVTVIFNAQTPANSTARYLFARPSASSFQNALVVEVSGGNRVSFYDQGGSRVVTTTITFGNVYTVKLTFNGTAVELFLDGVSVDTGTASSSNPFDISQNVLIGGGNTNRYLTGFVKSAVAKNASGTTVLNFDINATNVRHGDTKFKCATGQVVTINKAGNDPATIIKKSVLRFDGADDFMDGLLNQTVTGGYMFAAFSVLGDGGDSYGNLFSVRKDFQPSGGSGSFTFFRDSVNNNIRLKYNNAGSVVVHQDIFDDTLGDILLEAKLQSGSQISKVNNANEDNGTTSVSGSLSSVKFEISADTSGSTNVSYDLEFLALFPAESVPDEATASKIRNYINNRNNVFDLKDGFGYYFYDAQNAPVGNISSGSASWNGRIVGSDFGDTDRYLTQGTSDDQPVGDGYVVTFADNTDHLEIPQVTQAGWQVVGTSLGTFAYSVNNTAVTELNLLGNFGHASFRKAGNLYGIILLPESASAADIEAARKLLIDRGASDGSYAGSLGTAWHSRTDIVEFNQTDFSNTTSASYAWFQNTSLNSFNPISFDSCTVFIESWKNCTSLNDFAPIQAPLGNNFTSAWQGCSALTSFPAGAKLGTEANNVNFSNAWESSGLTSFSTPLPTASSCSSSWWGCTSLASFNTQLPQATNARFAWYNNTSLSDFKTTDIKNCADFTSTWQGTTALQSFPANAKLGTEANNVNFESAWNASGLTSFYTPLPTATTVRFAWKSCSSLTSFSSELPLVTNVYQAWINCTSLTSFSSELSSAADVRYAWYNCNSLTSFDTSLPSATNVYAAWNICSSLTDFSADVFANWNPSSISSGVFNLTWDGCTSLTAQSVENILTSIDASGHYATTNKLQGGSALADAGIDIDYNGDPLSAATNAAVTSLKSKGWSIIVNNVTL